jgi:hypothetical protein
VLSLVGDQDRGWAAVSGVSRSVLDRLERDYDNLRLALRWLLDHDQGERGLRLAGALFGFWFGRGHLREGRQWLDEALAPSAAAASEVRAKALTTGGWLAALLADYPTASRWAGEAQALYHALGQRRGEAHATMLLGRVALDRKEYAPARTLTERSLALLEGTDDRSSEALALHQLAQVAYYQADLPRSRWLQEQALALRRDLGEPRPIAACLNWLGHVAVAEGDLSRARALYTEGLGLTQALGFAPGYSLSLSCFANLAAAQRQARRAARLGAAALAQAETLGVEAWTTTQAGIDTRIDALRATLPEAEREAAWAEGRGMTLAEAIAEALAEEPDQVG